MNRVEILNSWLNYIAQEDKLKVPVTNRLPILNGYFDHVTIDETVDWATQWIKSGCRGYICTVNVAILMMMASDRRLQKFINKAALVVADGKPIVWASRWLSRPLPERVTGIDLIDALAKQSEQENFSIYLLGAKKAVIETVAARLQAKYPKLKISGVADGYFSPDEAPERVKEIRESGANILLVGMGVPRQEFFLEQYWSDLGVNLGLGVGGSFEVIAGQKKRAPKFMQELGLEWFYRLFQEPRRLWKRYLITNSRFIYCLLAELFAKAFLGNSIAYSNVSFRRAKLAVE
ncbi:WecB/TagA/CpsF family glycosyltransferase [Aerosakkonemataceae cyanobacterium BLCC-F154]|uniref:WecB/TagA/CpsF family glycosyltransferase n=1 Tax=Floridaenema fluviatile BLCC-F154 TaxID=3153640 RepID=A0ABV4Y644_9CYAN